METREAIEAKERKELKAQKITVERNGRIYLIQPHMLEDAEKLGATTVKKEIKNPPKELIIPGKKESKDKITAAVLPEMEISIKAVRDELNRLGVKFHPNTGFEKLKSKLAEHEGDKK